jgi:hypothetical protein
MAVGHVVLAIRTSAMGAIQLGQVAPSAPVDCGTQIERRGALGS